LCYQDGVSAPTKTTPSKVIVNLPPVELSQADYERLQVQAGKTDITPILATWVRYFIQQQLGGGVLVSGNSVRQIEKILGTQVTGEKSIVDAIGKTKGVEDGQFAFHVRVDPIFWGPLEDTAKQQGVTVEYLLTDVCNGVLENSWAYSWPAGRKTNHVADDWKTLCEFTGKEHPFGADVAAKAREVMEKA
jgi:hypothetical protein